MADFFHQKPDMLLADKKSQEAYADGLKRLAGADQSARIAELERECERLRERLEINCQCPYDGIATRDKTIAALQQELDRCRDDAKDVWGLAESRADTVVQLRAELEACRKDAERYRWLRSRVGVEKMFNTYTVYLPSGLHDDLDCEATSVAIDAAMQEGGV